MEVSLLRASELLGDAEYVILTGHVHPDGDCLGSMLALYHYLLAIGKNVEMLLDDDVPLMYNYLPGVQAIKRPGHDPVDAGLLIVLDASDADRLGKIKSLVNAPILNIDHHISNTRFSDYWYIDSHAAATGEIVFQLLRMMDVVITVDMAVCLYTAIATDCGFFRYANTSAATMRYAADLIECGVKPHMVSEYLEARPLESIVTLTKVLETLELHYAGKIAAITIFPDIVDNATENTEGFINYPRNIEGVEIAMMFKIIDENTMRVSLRSKGADVSQLAISFGGGGHSRAAGCTVTGKNEHAKRMIINAAVNQLKETG